MMIPISAEGDGGNLMLKNKLSDGKILGILILLASFLLIEYPSLASTPFVISDVNQASYIIVVLIMLPLTILISLKEDIHINRNLKSYIFGIFIFLLYLLAFAYIRVSFSYGFTAYRIDGILLPLILIALISIIFGISEIKKFKFLLVYALFASPILLIPILNYNLHFTYLNAGIVFAILKDIGIPVKESGLNIFLGGSEISIASTCTDIGAFVSLAMFLLPIAYFYSGKLKNKILWVVSSILLLFVLNLSRMLSISLIWVYYGIGSATSTLHVFLGEILFDITIIVMIVIAYKFRLKITKIEEGTYKKYYNSIKANIKPSYFVILVIAIISILGLFMNYPITQVNSYNALEFVTLNKTVADNITEYGVLRDLENINMTIVYLGQMNSSNSIQQNDQMFALSNSTFKSNSIIDVIVYPSYKPVPNKRLLFNNTKIEKKSSLLLNNGLVINYDYVISNGTVFYTNIFSVPYKVKNSNYISLNYLVITTKDYNGCTINDSLSNRIDSFIYNLLNGNKISAKYLCVSYKLAEGNT